VTITASGGVKLVEDNIDAAGEFLAIGAGSNSLSLRASATNGASFYAYTTSTSAGKIVVKSADKEETIYIASEEGEVYNVASATFPTLSSGGEGTVVVKLTDVFGNPITKNNADVQTDSTSGTDYFYLDTTDLDLEILGGSEEGSDWVYVSATKSWRYGDSSDKDVKSVSIASGFVGQVAMSVTLTGSDFSELGLPAPKASAFSTTNAASLETQIAALTAQVATLKANRVTKKRYNTLARKWNAAFPSQKVALKK
jgi:hypothetical protein